MQYLFLSGIVAEQLVLLPHSSRDLGLPTLWSLHTLFVPVLVSFLKSQYPPTFQRYTGRLIGYYKFLNDTDPCGSPLVTCESKDDPFNLTLIFMFLCQSLSVNIFSPTQKTYANLKIQIYFMYLISYRPVNTSGKFSHKFVEHNFPFIKPCCFCLSYAFLHVLLPL